MVKRTFCGALAAVLLLTAAGCGGAAPPAGFAPGSRPAGRFPAGGRLLARRAAHLRNLSCGGWLHRLPAPDGPGDEPGVRHFNGGGRSLLYRQQNSPKLAQPGQRRRRPSAGVRGAGRGEKGTGERPRAGRDPIGRDALVFIVNGQNPVESLTRSQLVDIYAGRITNWSEVGGPDQPIVAFQRDGTSGSQTLFKKLLMGSEPLMEAPTELRPGMMGGLIDGLAGYSGAGNALGYSVFYYASEMYQKPGLKFLAVDGVAPSAETIGDGSYP